MKIDKCLFVVAVLYATPAAAQSPSITWEPYTLAMANDRKEPAELGRFKAPLRHGQAAAGTIDLAVVRLRSRSSTPAAPLIYLDGGPGGAGYTAAVIPEFADLFDRIRATRDVILLSQRGTGLSRPRPACPADGPLPADFLVSVETMTAALGERARRCAESLRAKGLDIGAFNTEESAGDVAVLRHALGVPRVALFGFSYGTHLALAIMRRSPDAIDRVILAGTEGPGDTWKLPSTFDAQFDELARQAGGDLTATWLRLLARAAAQPLQVPVTMGDQTKTVAIGAAGLQYLLRRDVGDTNDWPVIPLLIAQADRGDFSLLGRLAGRRLAGLGSGMNLMPLASGLRLGCTGGAPSTHPRARAVALFRPDDELSVSRGVRDAVAAHAPRRVPRAGHQPGPDAVCERHAGQQYAAGAGRRRRREVQPRRPSRHRERWSREHAPAGGGTGCDRVLRRGKAAHVRAHGRPRCAVSRFRGSEVP